MISKSPVEGGNTRVWTNPTHRHAGGLATIDLAVAHIRSAYYHQSDCASRANRSHGTDCSHGTDGSNRADGSNRSDCSDGSNRSDGTDQPDITDCSNRAIGADITDRANGASDTHACAGADADRDSGPW